MNIRLRKEDFQVSGVDEYGKYYTVMDNIGFAESNGVQGFNRVDAGTPDGNGGTHPLYTDSVGNPYPKVGEAVIALLPFLNHYHKKDISVSTLRTPLNREEPALESTLNGERSLNDYDSQVAYQHEVEIIGNGWYTVYAFLLSAVSPLQGEAIPTTGVYFNKDEKRFYQSESGEELDISDLIDKDDVESIDLQYFLTAPAERKLHDIVGETADIGMKEGNCSDNYKRSQKAMMYYDGQIAGAHVVFNDGYRHKAQQIIEDLENSNPYEDC